MYVSVPLSGLSSFNNESSLHSQIEKTEGFRPLIGVIIFQLSVINSILSVLTNFVSVPLSGLSSFNGNVLTAKIQSAQGFRPLIGVIIFQHFSTKEDNTKDSIFRFRPLIGVIIFQHKKYLSERRHYMFPSPYRGYHLSTEYTGYALIKALKLFPSPYRGYHLSTKTI